jgi:hypothetical protein
VSVNGLDRRQASRWLHSGPTSEDASEIRDGACRGCADRLQPVVGDVPTPVGRALLELR